jgi:hypothetical protein
MIRRNDLRSIFNQKMKLIPALINRISTVPKHRLHLINQVINISGFPLVRYKPVTLRSDATLSTSLFSASNNHSGTQLRKIPWLLRALYHLYRRLLRRLSISLLYIYYLNRRQKNRSTKDRY